MEEIGKEGGAEREGKRGLLPLFPIPLAITTRCIRTRERSLDLSITLYLCPSHSLKIMSIMIVFD